jgi:hypothetical protein
LPFVGGRAFFPPPYYRHFGDYVNGYFRHFAKKSDGPRFDFVAQPAKIVLDGELLTPKGNSVMARRDTNIRWEVSLRSHKLEEELNSPEWRAECRHYGYILRGIQGKPRRYKTRAGCEKEFASLVQKGLPEDLFEVARFMVFGL